MSAYLIAEIPPTGYLSVLALAMGYDAADIRMFEAHTAKETDLLLLNMKLEVALSYMVRVEPMGRC